MLSQITDLIYESNQKKLNLNLIYRQMYLPFWVDGMRLKQILINLLANAKFTEKDLYI
jgi:signal transduction histidine kinase